MLLRKLEAYGFKSFAEKTEIEFKPGITAIIGPNGSGKSNISDAVRWVLGEQNIRNLRGAKSEDVIFSGSDKRRPLGVAEVSLIFDNSDGVLPLEFNEVIITRRVFRSGDGEYFINKSPCRLKDIHDLLVDAGLGRESMTVISQNKIDEVLNSKAEERRLLFEEAAGIMKYKNRKKEALRKLEDTEQNLTRVLDITSEIELQLGPLAESAERTVQYNEMAEEQKACQVTLLLDKLTHAEKNLEAVCLEQAGIVDEEIALSTRLSVGEAERENFTDKLLAIDDVIRGVETNISGTITEIERIDGKAAVLAERIGQEQRNRERLAQDIQRIQSEMEENRTKYDLQREEMANKQQQVVDLETVTQAVNADYQQTVTAIHQAEAEINLAQEQTFGQMQELVTKKNMLQVLERDIENQLQQASSLSKEQENLNAQLVAAEQLLQENITQKELLDIQIQKMDEKIKILTQQQNSLVQSLNEMVTSESQLGVQCNDSAYRLKVLSSMQEEYEGFGRGVKSVLKSEAVWRKDVGGAVAQILNVPDQYVVAIETALGGALQHIIVENDSTAKAAIQFLKTSNVGRATFLPLNTIKPMKPREAEISAAHAPGSVGFAAELITCEPRYRPVIDYLLGRTIVANNIDAALAIAKQHAFGVKIVTPDGELLNPGGSIAGGSTGKRESSFLSRGNEIELLKQAIIEQEGKRKTLRQRIADFKADVEGLDSRLNSATVERRSLEMSRAEVSIHIENIAGDVKRQALSCVTVESEAAACLRSGAEMSDKIAEMQKQIAEYEVRDRESKISIATRRSALQELQTQRDHISANITEIKIKLAALQQEVNSLTANCNQSEQAKNRLNKHIEELQTDQAKVDREIQNSQLDLGGVDADKHALLAQKDEQEKERTVKTTEKLAVLATQQKLEREIKDVRRKLNHVQARIHELELLSTKFGYEITSCQEQLQNLQITREQAQFLHRQEEHTILVERIAQLEIDIAELGTINPAAIEEYAKLKERYEFLRLQYLDLIEAKNYVMTIIKDIDATMSKQFRAAFQQINEHFGELFIRLFSGGKAQLELSEPDDILTSGIEILVQPPGKKQQNLALLSGGERALTVIALLFAFLTFRPTPFCLLDEIDAALDEANVQRFSDFLRDYARNTQFIIVTHRKGTMEVADVMHGVTMEESGVSKLISVKFMDQAG